jgi:hypothetical protein
MEKKFKQYLQKREMISNKYLKKREMENNKYLQNREIKRKNIYKRERKRKRF